MRKQFVRFEDLMDQNRSELLNDEDALDRLDDRLDARNAEKELRKLKKAEQN
ncbi:FbpB family small basic protein [Alkalicoccobacillus plakortidis]|uniref:FbpB family small basic protein n=1 Tax=Alkalicoccobacillus plakortidis TaxID=444060 RepID=A0ABT0XN76_9BACI|nr:FbpB family small basic protein [Alkalicoccobacillus plakortidis]MCM2676783.1 FbpB family small basic protein [Alkalicoccobacillus plakortidis]